MTSIAIFFPPRTNMHEAIVEANGNRPARGRLATDGRCVAWLPHIPPGWYPINAAVMRRAA